MLELTPLYFLEGLNGLAGFQVIVPTEQRTLILRHSSLAPKLLD